jgi:fatty-acyl-CoA synthase
MHSGDLATMDEEGYINIVGRIKDTIMRGGENIYRKLLKNFYTPIRKLKKFRFEFQMKSTENKSVFGFKVHDKSELTALEIKEYCRGK